MNIENALSQVASASKIANLSSPLAEILEVILSNQAAMVEEIRLLKEARPASLPVKKTISQFLQQVPRLLPLAEEMCDMVSISKDMLQHLYVGLAPSEFEGERTFALRKKSKNPFADSFIDSLREKGITGVSRDSQHLLLVSLPTSQPEPTNMPHEDKVPTEPPFDNSEPML